MEFALVGAIIGYIIGRLQQLSQQVSQLNQLVNKLKEKLKSATFSKPTLEEPPVKSATESQQPVLQTESLDVELIENDLNEDSQKSAFATYSTSQPASLQPKRDSIVNQPITQNKFQSTTVETSASKANSNAEATTINQPKAAPESRPNPDIISKVINWLTSYFTTGNIVVRVGAIILFFGIAFLLKYAAENTEIPIEARLISVSIGAIALLIFGWRLRDKQQGYGLILQGAAVGILYLTLFASFRLYSVIPSGLAFAMLFLFSGLAMSLAVLQNSRTLAILSVVGGFLAPILTSTGSGSHIALFGYYAVLNIGIFSVAWFKSWRMLNLVGFAFTFLIGTAWGVTQYQPSNFATTEPFLILFFVLYSAIALLFAVKQKPQLKGYLDSTLVFGLPMIAFGLQAAMVESIQYRLAWSSFALAAFYILSAFILLKGKNPNLRVIAEAYLALGTIFISLVIPFALDGQWVAASWAIEGAGLVWVGLRQSRWFAKYFGTLIQLAGGIIFLIELGLSDSKVTLFDSNTLGIILVAIAGLFTSYQVYQRKSQLKPLEANSHFVFLIWGLLWWYIGGIIEFTSFAFNSPSSSPSGLTDNLIIFITLSGLIWHGLYRKFEWQVLTPLPWVTLSLSITIGMVYAFTHSHLLESWSAPIWIFAIVSFYGCLFDREKRTKETVANIDPSAVLHFLGLLALMGLSLFELVWLTDYLGFAGTSWAIGLIGLLSCFWLFLLSTKNSWPVNKYPICYSKGGITVLFAGTIIWMLYLNFPHSGNASPLPYIPLINPLDLVQGLLILFMYRVVTQSGEHGIQLSSQVIKVCLAIITFIWLNVILLRTIHTWTDIPYQAHTMFSSFVVQTSISIFWTVLGLIATIWGARKSSRNIWIYGAGLIAIVVVKLFAIDLDNSSSIERIVSFVVVGLLLLIVGYFSPLPTKQVKEQTNE